ncbi:hypothetical protein OH77DRAFT_1594448 [Trametes cingulata]|nr:hypothetical protein OH77DRAFT_1594448 [Trametes cingulata]
MGEALPYIDSEDQLENEIQHWKNHSFVPHHLKLHDVLDSLTNGRPLVEVKQEHPSRWVVTKLGSHGTKEAIFHTVAIWKWNSDMQTGNFVPPGEKVSSRVAESRIQDTPNNLCQTSYGCDTVRDKTLWDAQARFEELAAETAGFNAGKKPRRTWQDSTRDGPKDLYIMSAQIFCRRTRYSGRKEASVAYALHPWIAAIVKKPGSVYYANPDRPVVLEAAGNELRDITDTSPPYVKAGYLVWISFFVEFIIGTTHWFTTFTPCEIVRVGTVAPDLFGRTLKPAADGELEEPKSFLKAGHKFILNEDFPMDDGRRHTADIGDSGPGKLSRSGTASARDGPQAEVEGSSTVQFTAEDQQDCWYGRRELVEIPVTRSRSGTPLADWNDSNSESPLSSVDGEESDGGLIQAHSDQDVPSSSGTPALPAPPTATASTASASPLVVAGMKRPADVDESRARPKSREPEATSDQVVTRSRTSKGKGRAQ